MFKSTCGKCRGTGRVWALHVQNGVCFDCDGLGYRLTKTDPVKLARARKRRAAKREKAEAASRARHVAASQARQDQYINDPRIGLDTLARCARHPAYAFEVYMLLEKIDAGEDMPHVLRNIAE